VVVDCTVEIEDALLAAVHAAPDDDQPRRVLADWWSEHGDPRGDLVQLQCELGRGDLTREHRRRLRDAEGSARSAARAAWFGSLDVDEYQLEWRRGFVASVRLPYELLIRHAAQLVRHPVVEVMLRDCPDPKRVRAALAVPFPTTIRILHGDHVSVRPVLDEILGRAPFANLVTLRLIRANLDAVEALRLATSSPRSLRELELGFNFRLGVAGFGALVATRGWDVLDVRCCKLDEGVVAALASSPFAHELRSLSLSYNGFGFADAQHLARVSFGELHTLHLDGCLTERSLSAVLEVPAVRRVETLWLSQNRLGPGGAASLAATPFSALAELNLAECMLGDPGAAVLANAPWFHRLSTLCVRHNGLTAAGVLALLRSSSLTRLQLRGNSFRLGLSTILAEPAVARLRLLELSEAQLDDDDALALAAAPALAALADLDLSDNRIGDRGARALAASPYLDNLESLSLPTNEIGVDGTAALRDRFGTAVWLSRQKTVAGSAQ
jgi:uncharacterized protein (TIGR02996 family)